MTDAVRKFWIEWLETPELERPKKLEQLARMGLGEYLKENLAKGIDRETTIRTFCNLWNSYFEDFYAVMEQDIPKRKMHPAQLGTNVKKK